MPPFRPALTAAVAFVAAFAGAYVAIWTQRPPDEAAPAGTAVAPSSSPGSYADAVARAAPSVVSLYIARRRDAGSPPPGTPASPRPHDGSTAAAVAVDSAGLLVTSHHVIDGADTIEALLADGRSVRVTLIGSDPETDLAVLRAEGSAPPPIPVGRTSGLRVGDVVLAIGNPFGFGQTVTHGIVSATGRNHLGISRFENFIQTDAAINPGNSGGPLVNVDGEMVGINTAIYSETGGSHGIGFAVPVELAMGIVRQLTTTGRVGRGWLGITGQDLTPTLAATYGLRQRQGVLVNAVAVGSPAQRAGLRSGDLVDSLDGTPVESSFDILNHVASREPGTRVRLGGWRGGLALDVQAVVAERPAGLR
ncbi:MAG: trypsin-like peptidase domain-containing protein [Gammaproteobacteria bacterium]|jgi:serine protease DegS|nr:trypsin-like peptidase domain-containing protein [Gammaproteobacteria bacterium]